MYDACMATAVACVLDVFNQSHTNMSSLPQQPVPTVLCCTMLLTNIHHPLSCAATQNCGQASLPCCSSSCLCDGERVLQAQGRGLGALEPPLVADLHLQDVQVAAAHGGSDELVASSLIAVGCRYARTLSDLAFSLMVKTQRQHACRLSARVAETIVVHHPAGSELRRCQL